MNEIAEIDDPELLRASPLLDSPLGKVVIQLQTTISKKMSKNEAIRNWKSSLPERKPAGRMLFAVLAREDSIAEVRSSRSAEVVVVGAIFFFNSAWFAGRCRNHGDVG
jgi:hypothetical protein